jgi:hypothetical protein
MTGLPSFLAHCDLGSVGPANDWNSRRSIAEELKRRIDQEILAVAIQKGNVLFPPDYDDEGCQVTGKHRAIGRPSTTNAANSSDFEMIFETIRTVEDSDSQSGIQFQAIHTYTDETKHPTYYEANHHTIDCPAHS